MFRALLGIALLALGLPASAAADAQVSKAGLSLDAGPAPYAGPLARTLTAIAEYSRWPSERETLRLCLAGPSDHAERFTVQPLARGRQLRPVAGPVSAIAPERCEIVYLGRLSLAEQRAIIAGLRETAVLTIAENDPACRSGAMICLLFELDEMAFRINLDAVSRSQVRIDPRVLRMSESPGGD